MDREDIDTPALLIDADIMEKNMRTMREWLDGKRVKLRPHFKTPKTPIIAWRQVEHGASGFCAQKLGEAEVLTNAGIKDVLLTNEIVDDAKLETLAHLNRYSDIKVLVDNQENIEALSKRATRTGVRMGVLVEVDVGMKRCGISDVADALRLADLVAKSEGLLFEGIQCYSGHLQMADLSIGREKKVEECAKVCDRIGQVREDFERAGRSPEIVSGAGTGSYRYEYPVLDEIQAGSYIFMDWRYKQVSPEFDIALSLLTTVISTPTADRAIVDAGLKSISTDGGLPLVKGPEGVQCTQSSEEHMTLSIKDPLVRFKIGDKVELYPSHCCTTVNLHDRYHVMRRGDLEAVWQISARGKTN